MKSDISRDTFKSADKYTSVRLQQGRVLVDADWNEQVDIRAYQDRIAASDAIGVSGAPAENPGLEIGIVAGGVDLNATPGRYYIEGVPLETEATLDFTAQPDFPNYQLPTEDGMYLAYAETRETIVTALEDPELKDPALNGFDTATRGKRLLQLKLLRDGHVGDEPDCFAESSKWTDFYDANRPEKSARMKARQRPNAETGQAGEYSGEQNALYRVEIHRGGAPGTATFKWSRSNASEVLEWTAQTGDGLSVRSATPRRGYFAPGDWVELLDESFELTNRPGGLVQILADDGDLLRIKLDSYIAFDGGSSSPDISQFTGGLRKIRRWSMFGSTGELQTSADSSTYIALEHGLEIAFTAETDAAGVGEFRTGDAWLIPARSITRDIEWSTQSETASGIENAFASPALSQSAFARLAYVQLSAGVWSVVGDCRRVFPTLSDPNLVYHSGDGQEGLPGVFLDEPLLVRVAAGSVPVCDARVRFTIVAGEASASVEDLLNAANTGVTIDVLTDAEGLAGVRWQLDPNTAQPRIEATLLDETGTGTPLLVRFNAGLSIAARLQHEPDVVLDPVGTDLMAGVTTVRDALDRLELIKANTAGDTITGSLTIDEDLTVQGQLTVQGDVIAKDLAQTPGNVVLGDQDADRITVHGELKSEHILDAVVVDDAMQVREDLLVDGAIGPRSGIGIGEITGDWKYRVSMSVTSTVANSPYSRKSQQVYASDASDGAQFASAFAVDGDWMLVSANRDDNAAGAVYAFQYIDGRWVEKQKLTPSNALAGNRFGFAVAIQGDIAVVGSIPDSAGANPGYAYVFLRNGDHWVEVQQLFGAGVSNGDLFGAALLMEGDYIVVASPGDNGLSGAVYIFYREAGVWNEQVKIPGVGGGIAPGLTLYGNTLVIGNPSSNSFSIYIRTGNTWNHQQSDAGPFGDFWFGAAVAGQGDVLAVGVPQADGNPTAAAGTVKIYEYNGSMWLQTAVLTPIDSQVADRFGRSLDFVGDVLLIGAPGSDGADGVDAGAAYIFRKNGTNWTQEARFTAAEPAARAGVGRSVRLRDGVAYMGNASSDPLAEARFRAGTLAIIPETPTPLINYQHELTINTAQLVTAGKMNEDGSDILFMNEDDLIPLPYWIESGMNTAATKIWVRLPSIAAGAATRIYLHYGNENAVARSSTADTFLGEIEALSAAWQLEDGSGTTVRDLSGNGNDGTIQGPATWGDGRFGTSLDFNGTNNFVDLPAGSFFAEFEIASVSMWFYTDATWASLDSRVPWRFTASAQALLGLWDRNGVLSLNMAFRNGRHVSVPVDLQALVGRWNHLVCTHNGKDKNSGANFRYYLNGIDLGNGTIDTGEVGDNFNINDNAIGADAQTGSSFNFWNGRLNHLQVFQRVLTEGEISGLYNHYGYATTLYPGRVLLRTYTDSVPIVSLENELPVPFALPEGWQYRRSVTIQNDFAETFGEARRAFGVTGQATYLRSAGHQVLVGAFQDDGVGAVYVLEQDAAGNYVEKQKLVGSNLSANDGFGGSIDVDGDVAVIGASAHDGLRGAIYVFERTNGVWYETARIVGPVAGHRIGETVTIAGDYVFGGGSGTPEGVVRAFFRSPVTGWTETQTLVISDSEPGDIAFFVTADQDIAIVSAINKAEGGVNNGGAAYVFRLNSETGAWIEEQKLVASDRSPGDRFGIFPSIYENTLSIGADDDPNGNGAVYIFEQQDDTWVETAKLTAPDGSLRDRFGFRSHLTRDTLITASQYEHTDGGDDVGAVYVFRRSGSGWGPAIKITAGEFSRNNLYFGYDSIATEDSILVASFPGSGVGEIFQHKRLRPQTINDVQIPIELDTTTLIADQKLRLQGDDLFITDEDGMTPLPYYIEGGLNSRTTKIWARVPGIRAGETKNLFLHYGDPAAQSRSSANQTFLRVIDSVAAAYTLDEVAGTRVFDASGNENAGLLNGPVRKPGLFGGSLEFDGLNDYVELRDDPTVDIKADITLACWFRCDGVGAGFDSANGGMLISKHRTGGSRSYSIDVAHVNGRSIHFVIFDTSDNTYSLFSKTAVNYGEWYHVAGTYDRLSGIQRVYVNGSLDAELNIGSIDLQQTSQPLLLAAQSDTVQPVRRFLVGSLDEPRVYDRALSSPEVRDLFENRGDVKISANTRSEFVRRNLPAPPQALPAPTEERIAYNLADSWSHRQAITIDNTLAASTEFTKLSAGALDDLDYLGEQVFVADDFAFAAAVGDDDLGGGAGAVYVYRRESVLDGGDRWLFDSKLTASDGAANHGFGGNLSFDGASLVVTAQNVAQSYVFVRDGNGWSEQAILTPSATASSFGYSASISDDLAIVGDHSSSVSGVAAGAAYVFRRTGVTWTEEAVLTHPTPSASIFFGSAVVGSDEANRIAVGCRGDGGSSVNRGAVYVFDWDGSVWQRGADLVASDAANDDSLGESIGMFGDTIVAGAYLKNGSTGAAYVFRKSGEAWIQEAKLTASDGVAGDELSVEIAISGDRILAGARQSSNGPGKAYIFKRVAGDRWVQERILASDGTSTGFLFGNAVSISPNFALVGHRADGVQILSRGAAYLFALTTGDTEIQTPLTIDTAALIAADQMQLDCGDLYFTDSDGRGSLSHWTESGKNTAETKVWVNIPFLPFGETKTIYLHAGNPRARSRSSFADTFVREVDGLIAAYDFDEDSGTALIDKSGSSFDGTLQSGATRTAGKFGTAAGLNGAGQYASLPGFPGRINIYDFTVSIWGRLDVAQTATGFSGRNYLFDFRGDGAEPPDSIGLYLEHLGGGNLALVSGLEYDASSFSASQNPVPVTPGVWNHYVLRRRGLEFVIFLNGERLPYLPPVVANIVPVRANPVNFSNGKRIGSASNNTTVDWHGALDALRIYDRALTDTEVRDAYLNFSDVNPERPGREILRKYLANPPAVNYAIDIVRRIVPGDAANLDSFATGIGVGGQTVVLGSPDDDDNGGASGSAYIYRREGDAFAQLQKIFPGDPAASARFGASAAVGGEHSQYVFIGAQSSTTFPAPGRTYIFERDRENWTELQKLQASNTTNTDGFGAAIAASGNHVAVGAPYHDGEASDGGAVFVFYRDGALFTQQAVLSASDVEATDVSFGLALSMNATADLLVVGAHLKKESATAPGGAAYVFIRDGNQWTQQAKLISDDRASGDNFGFSVAISADGDTVAIGANDESAGDGAVYLFERSGTTWNQTLKIPAPDAGNADHFGEAVAMYGGVLAIGARADDTASGTDAGSLHVYRRSNNGWVFTKKYEHTESATNGHYAKTLAIDAEYIYAGNAPEASSASVLQTGVLFAIRHGAEIHPYREAHGWSYSETIELEALTGPGLTVTDYQTMISIDTATPIGQGRMQPDGSDIVFFADDDVTELDHWIEGGLNTNETKVWLKLPEIAIEEITKINLRYGFPDATSRSSANDTFIREISEVRVAYEMVEGSGTIIADASGSGNPATIVDGTWTSGPSRIQNAILFDGFDDHVLIPDNPALNVTEHLTLSAWIRCDGPGTGAEAADGSFFISREHSSNDSAYALLIRHATRRLDFEIWSPGLSFLRSVTALNYGQWYHVAATYDRSSGEARIYLDGQLDVASNFGPVPIFTPARSALLGAYFGLADETVTRGFFKGAIAQVGIYNTALSAAEVADQYAEASLFVAPRPGRELIRKTARHASASNLLALNFNEATGAIAADVSGNSNDAVLNGATWDTAGIAGSALRFNGSGAYARTPVSWPAIGDADFTIYAWINMDVIVGDHRIIAVDQFLQNFQFLIGNEGGLTVALELYLGGSSTLKSNLVTWNTGQWYFVCAKRKNGLITFFRDSEQIGTVDGQYTVATSSFLDIGYRTANSAYPFDGRIDELRLYDRALSDAEIVQTSKNPGLPLNAPLPVQVNVLSWAEYITDTLRVPVAWNYRQPIAIDNTASGDSLTNYQQLITVDTATLVRENKLRADCRDLLFVDENDTTELNYWIESGVNSEATRIWVKIPTIPANGTRTISMYYGNRGTHARSSASGIFVREIGGVVAAYLGDAGQGDTLIDYSGNANTGLVSGATSGAGVRGGALFFDGIDDHVRISHSVSLAITEQITLSVWARIDGPGTGLEASQHAYLISKDQTTGNVSYALFMRHPTRQLDFEIYSPAYHLVRSTPLNYGQWYHIVATYEGSSGIGRIYLDGLEDVSESFVPFSIDENTLSVLLGAYFQTADEIGKRGFLNGALGEPRIFNRALTAAEISDQFAGVGYASLFYPGRTLVRQFAMNEPLVAQGVEEEAVFNLLSGPYRVPITIDRANETETLNDYQTLFTIDTAALIAANKTAPDLSDIYFTTIDAETQLSFWIESGVNTANTRIWVRVPRITAGEIKTIYMYYGDAGAGGDSSAEATFAAALDGVAAAYTFDEGTGTSVLDSSGNGNTGTLTNDPVWTAGQRGSALLFDGANDYVIIPNSPSVSLTSNLSITGWIRVDGPGAGSQSGAFAYLINKHHTNTNESYATLFDHATRRIIFQVFEVGNISHEMTSNRQLDYGEWFFLAGTYDSVSGEQRLYIDGVLDSIQNEGSFNISQTTLSVTIGAFFQTPESLLRSFLNGAIDEPRIYNQALTADEIRAQLYGRSYFSEAHPGREFIRRIATAEPVLAPGGEEQFPFLTQQEGWPYRVPVQIDNTGNANTLTDFQVAITLNTLGPIGEGKMQADGRDVLIADSDAITQLPFWIEGPMNSPGTKIWVNIPFIAANSLRTVYVFYGNAQATALSDRASVFIREVPDVIAAYTMDEISGNTLPDLSGNGYDGTINGAIPAAGRLGQALTFDGVDDFVTLPGFPGQSVVGDFTVQLWARQTGFPPNDRTYLLNALGTEGVIGTNSVALILDDAAGQIQVHHVASWTSGGFTEYETDIASPIGEWTLHTFARSGNELRAYVNGVRIAENYRSGGPYVPPKTDNLSFAPEKRLGTFYFTTVGETGHWFAGVMEAVRFYDRALTDAEITDLHQQRGHVTLQLPGTELVRKFAATEPLTVPGLEENIPYQESSAQIRLAIDGIIESRDGGFRFPDGSVQASVSAGGAVFPASYGLLSESPYAPEKYATNSEEFRSAIDFSDWTVRAQLPVSFRSFNLVALNSRLYALGGLSGSTIYNHTIEYNPESNEWDFRSQMPDVRRLGGAVGYRDRIYLMGGSNNAASNAGLPTNFIFDPQANNWESGAPMPVGLVEQGATVGANGWIHIIGGRTGGSEFVNTNYAYDPIEDVWFSLAPFDGAPRGYFGVVTAPDGKLHVLGGYSGTEYATHEVYDPGTDRWSNRAPLPGTRYNYGNAMLFGDRIYITGGGGNGGSALTTIIYDIPTDRWSSVPGINRDDTGTAAIGDTIYAVGGFQIAYNTLKTVEAISVPQPIHLHQRTPLPATGGAIRVTGVTATSVTLRWSPALAAGATGLNYRVFYSNEPNIRTPGEMIANGIPVGAGELDAVTAIVPGLTTGAHYFNVLVEGDGGTSAAYEMAGPLVV